MPLPNLDQQTKPRPWLLGRHREPAYDQRCDAYCFLLFVTANCRKTV